MSIMVENVIAAGADNRPPILEKIINGLFQFGTIDVPATLTTPAFTRERTLDDLTDKEKIREACDIRATNIVLQGLPPDVYSLVNHHTVAKEIWDKVKLLIEGTKLSLFAQLINDMNTIGMTMKKLQVNTKFLNNLQPKWSKFVTDVKLAKDMHESSLDQLYAYLREHEVDANEVRMTRQ
ncbi:hypothetical protein Tco_1420978 [Tanacetum coccineum]